MLPGPLFEFVMHNVMFTGSVKGEFHPNMIVAYLVVFEARSQMGKV